jgi:hypothetical protein
MKKIPIKKVMNTAELRKSILNGQREFALALQAGMYSRKTIRIKLGLFRVVNHIDGSKQWLTGRQLYTRSNIGRNMRIGAFFPIPGGVIGQEKK